MLNVPEIVKAEIGPALGLSETGLAVTLREPLKIQSNRLFDIFSYGRHLIIKEYLQPGELEAAPLREFQALQVLAPLDLAPQPLFYKPDLGPLVVYEFMPGQMWDRRRPGSAELSLLAETWLKIQAMAVDWLARGTERSLVEVEEGFLAQFQAYRDWTAAAFAEGRQAADLCLELLSARGTVFRELADSPAVLRFCRADPRFANVIQRLDGRLGLVDWEDSGLRDPARELADILCHPNQEDLLERNEWQTFSESFLSVHRKADPAIDRRLHLYLAVFPLFWLNSILKRGLHQASEDTLPVTQINEMPINQRLRRYLACVLAWPEMDFQDEFRKIQGVNFFPIGNPWPE